MTSDENKTQISKQNTAALTTDLLGSNLIEIKEQVISFGQVLQKIVDEIQNVPDARAVDAFKQQVLQKQMVLETLVEENSCTLELLKHDVVSITSDIQRLKSRFHDLLDERASDPAPPLPLGIKGCAMDAVDALRNHPLSSIPPRQLSEGDAICFLKAIDEIVTTADVLEKPRTTASGE